jgi:hypothetical protein
VKNQPDKRELDAANEYRTRVLRCTCSGCMARYEEYRAMSAAQLWARSRHVRENARKILEGVL